jgi:hypothetical protein
VTLEEFFEGQELSRQLFEVLRAKIEVHGPVELRVTKSQIAFRRDKAFAWAWMPGKYLRRRAAPLVLSVSLPDRDGSPRWKSIVEPVPGRFMHHLELYTIDEIDDEVCAWLQAARNHIKEVGNS